MSDRRIRSIVIVGGGTAGWMAAAGLSKGLDCLDPQKIRSKLEEIRTAVKGCAEAMPAHWDFIRSGGATGGFRRRPGARGSSGRPTA